MTPRARKAMYAKKTRRPLGVHPFAPQVVQAGGTLGAATGLATGFGLYTLGRKHGLRDPKYQPGVKRLGMGHITEMKAGKGGVFRVRRLSLGEHAAKLYQKVPKIPMGPKAFAHASAKTAAGLMAVGAVAGGAGAYKLAQHLRARRRSSRAKRG